MIRAPLVSVITGMVAAVTLSASVVLAQDMTNQHQSSTHVLADGSVEISGIEQPGLESSVPEQCSGQSEHVAVVVCTANAFLATLSDAQRARVVLPLNQKNSTSWSNLPCGADCRVGILMSELEPAQRKAALTVLKAVSSDGEADGFQEITQIMMADDILTGSQGDSTILDKLRDAVFGLIGGMNLSYSSGTYLIAFLGEPDVSKMWQLQFGGHHLGILRTFSEGNETSATPNFVGVEPKVWIKDGVTYAPLNDDRDAMAAMLASFSPEQLKAAKLEASFSDVLLGSGKDGQFPKTKQGVAVSQLDDAQRKLVLAAIHEWVGDTSSKTSEIIMRQYTEQLDQIFIAFSGNSALSSHGDYVRIDGPGVWIEFVCQDGVVYRDQIHYHTIWRDHVADYGSLYDFNAGNR